MAQHFRKKKIHRIRAFSPCYLIFVSIFLRYSESKPSTTSSVIAILLFERTKDFCKTIFARATTPFSMLTVCYIVSIQLIPAILKCFTAVEFNNCSNHKVLLRAFLSLADWFENYPNKCGNLLRITLRY